MPLTLASLSGIEDMLRDSLDALEVHGDTVWDNEQRLRARELALRQGQRRENEPRLSVARNRSMSRPKRDVAPTSRGTTNGVRR